MFPEIWESVTGTQARYQAATAYGFKRFSIQNQYYPAAVRTSKKEKLNGKVVTNVSSNTLKLLNDYEGELYSLEKLSVYPQSSSNSSYSKIYASIYLLKKEYKHLLSKSEWLPEQFDLKAYSKNA